MPEFSKEFERQITRDLENLQLKNSYVDAAFKLLKGTTIQPIEELLPPMKFHKKDKWTSGGILNLMEHWSKKINSAEGYDLTDSLIKVNVKETKDEY